MNRLRGIALGTLLALATSAAAIVFEQREFANAEQLERYKTLNAELRCLVCQNQNIADSDAELAADLRREVYRMITEGKSDETILEFMVTRYGDFVLYRPPLKAKTVLLWSAPFVLGIGGILLLLLQLRRRHADRATAPPLNDEERARLQSLLDSD